ncbi:hypothetical protein D3C81_1838910 [compost metagenome]
MHACHFPARPVPIPGQPAQRTGIGQLLLGTGIESRPFPEVGDVDKCTVQTGRFNAPGVVLTKALDHAQAHANRRLRPGDRFQAAIPVAGAHVHRTNL